MDEQVGLEEGLAHQAPAGVVVQEDLAVAIPELASLAGDAERSGAVTRSRLIDLDGLGGGHAHRLRDLDHRAPPRGGVVQLGPGAGLGLAQVGGGDVLGVVGEGQRAVDGLVLVEVPGLRLTPGLAGQDQQGHPEKHEDDQDGVGAVDAEHVPAEVAEEVHHWVFLQLVVVD